jgi:hypothetical protein
MLLYNVVENNTDQLIHAFETRNDINNASVTQDISTGGKSKRKNRKRKGKKTKKYRKSKKVKK